jgi:hypothetical protein
MYKDMEPLFANPVLPFLALALAADAFQDCYSVEDIFAIPPPDDGTLYQIRIKKQILKQPFFQTLSSNGPTGKIKGASIFSTWLVNLGHRTGYRENIHVHDFRAEALVKADSTVSAIVLISPSVGANPSVDHGYSIDKKEKFAGHSNSDIFFDSYMPQMSTVDGQSSYWGRGRRIVHLEGFRSLSLDYHPQLLQSLPAKVQDDLASREDFIILNTEIESLGKRLREPTIEDERQAARARREELYWHKRQLVSAELSKWREVQPYKISSKGVDNSSQVSARPSFFNRIRQLDPPRDHLADLLFLDAPLRSTYGRTALRDMITLCKENPEVAYCPSLRPEEGRCPVLECAQEMDWSVPISS